MYPFSSNQQLSLEFSSWDLTQLFDLDIASFKFGNVPSQDKFVHPLVLKIPFINNDLRGVYPWQVNDNMVLGIIEFH